MSAMALSPGDFRPRQDGGLGPGAVLALLAHGGLIAALALGLNWRLPQPNTVAVAELWASVPMVAAPPLAAPPLVVPPPASPAPVTPQPPTSPVKPLPVPLPIPPRPAEPPAPSAAEREAAIVLEKAAQRKKMALAEAASAAKLAKAKAELALEQSRAQKRKAQDEAQQEAKRKQAAADAKALALQEAEAKAQEALVAKQREENLKRMLGQAGAAGATGAAGTAAAAGPATSAGYAARVSAKIKSQIIDAATVRGNPVTEVEVRCAPDGSITGRRITKPSGNPTWDDIVLRAIDRSATLPRDTDGRIPGTMLLTFSRQE